MKLIVNLLVVSFLLFFLSGCKQSGTAKKEAGSPADTNVVADTGYTGIKQYMSGTLIVKEVTFKNGVREGLMKSFYQNGKLRQTFWYRNDLREDSAKWYYEGGEVFRSTPYVHDTIDGIQIQYYRSGKIKAKLNYKKGLRTFYLEEFLQDGKKITGYPELVVNTKDDYNTKGIYSISLHLSNNSTKVKYYRYDSSEEVYDTAHCKEIKTIKGVASFDLKKSGAVTSGSTSVVAEVLTGFGNNMLIYKKIPLPYNNLK